MVGVNRRIGSRIMEVEMNGENGEGRITEQQVSIVVPPGIIGLTMLIHNLVGIETCGAQRMSIATKLCLNHWRLN